MQNNIRQVLASSDLTRLRRLALSAQGLLQAQPFGRGRAGARRAISHLGYVQIDTLSVVERAHHHVLQSRVPHYQPEMMDQLLANGEIFEYWSHAAAFLPMDDFRFSLPYKHAIKNGQTHWYKTRDQALMADLLARVRSDGPIRARDLESGTAQRGAWWDWKPAKKALEQLYIEGDLMVSDRAGFQKSYDLAERVLPTGVDTRMPDTERLACHLLDQQLRCHGLVSLKGLTYLRRNPALRKAMKTQVDERLAERMLEAVQLSDGEVFLLPAGALDQPLPRLNNRLRILSPFDNSVIQRDRLRALFQYDYQLECYLPAARRQYGYFSLPLLYRGEFIGRMDCKAHRKIGQLEVRYLHLEPHRFEQDAVIAALVEALQVFCPLQQCDRVVLSAAHTESLLGAVQKALQQV